jgi:two-component system, sporulation sensor kinase E
MTVKELQHLAAAMAHEVRNPLNSMAIHVELLEGRLRKGGVAEEALKSLTVMAQEIERVDKILEHYLEWAGPADSARAAADARELLAAAVARVRPVAEARGVAIELQAPAGLGSWIVDGEALVDALAALGEEAVRASPRGSTVMIAASGEEDATQAEISISDAADPVAPDEAGRFFHMGGKGRGAHVGVLLAKQIVKSHGGSVAVKRGERGNVFLIRFPLDEP